MKKSYDVAAGILTFTSADGSVQTLEVSKLADTIRAQAVFHGLSQKIGDSYAGAGAEPDPEAYARQCVAETIEQLIAGNWKATAGGGGTRYGTLVTALAAVSGKTLDEAKEIVEGLSDDERKELQGKTKIKLAMAKIKAERDAAKIAALEKMAAAEG